MAELFKFTNRMSALNEHRVVGRIRGLLELHDLKVQPQLSSLLLVILGVDIRHITPVHYARVRRMEGFQTLTI